MKRHSSLIDLLAGPDAPLEESRGIWLARRSTGGPGELRSLPRSALGRAARELAVGLQQLGLAAGARVVIVTPVPEDAIVLLFAVMIAGLVPVPLTPPLTAQELAHFTQRLLQVQRATAARVVVTSARLAERLAERESAITGHARLVTVQSLRGSRLDPAPVASAPHDAALIEWDGKQLRSRSAHEWLERLAAARRFFAVRPDDVIVSWIAPLDGAGLTVLLLALHCDCRLVLLPELEFLKEPRIWLETLSEARASLTFAPAEGYGHCLRRVEDVGKLELALGALRVMGGAGAGLPAALRAALAERLAPAGLPASALEVDAALPGPQPSSELLSHGQRGLWFLAQLSPDSVAYNVQFCLRICASTRCR
jgi:fatty-acyl-CoA synthase